MRITSLLVVLFTAMSCAVLGCSIAADPGPDPDSEADGDLVSASAAVSAASSDSFWNICRQKWTCDATSAYYVTRTQCTAACGGDPCYLDYACTGDCICP
jgi:hypothetical protein